MLALITGASSGMGKDFAYKLSKMGYDLIIVARNKDALLKLKEQLKTNVEVYSYDLSKEENVFKLYENTKDKNIDLLINNAGYGVFGEFINTSLEEEINMINLNITSLHILTKLYLKDMIKKDKGRILNVSSSAAFQAGPLMSTYYASKAYVKNLSMAIYEELRRKKSNVHISILCPGPVDTNFNNRAGVKFGVKSLTSQKVVDYALNKTFKNKLLIIPGFTIKCAVFANRIISSKLMLKLAYKIQKKKEI